MRPQQQNRRMRGRGGNNNNRKGPNPLTRSYESNGPDVKIRGTAQQVADKYATLARDAQSAGDRVMAENYLQHAEHYNRLIAAAQAQMQPQHQQQPQRDKGDEDDLDEQESTETPQQQRATYSDGSGPQPVIEGMPAEVAFKDRQVNGGNGAKPNGHANGESDSKAETPQEAGEKKAETAEEETAEAAPKPKRTRRPRARKSADTAETSEASEAESATAQS